MARSVRPFRAGIAGLEKGTFVEGLTLDSVTSERAPIEMIGRRISTEEAAKVLDRI